MWLYTSRSFVSIVASKEMLGRLVVRARRKEDILELFPFAPVVETKEADYMYRAYINRSDVMHVVSQYVANIGYTNFKDSVPKEDLVRKSVYGKIWSESLELESYQLKPYSYSWKPMGAEVSLSEAESMFDFDDHIFSSNADEAEIPLQQRQME